MELKWTARKLVSTHTCNYGHRQMDTCVCVVCALYMGMCVHTYKLCTAHVCVCVTICACIFVCLCVHMSENHHVHHVYLAVGERCGICFCVKFFHLSSHYMCICVNNMGQLLQNLVHFSHKFVSLPKDENIGRCR